VVHIYEHRCAFCGVRMLTSDGHTAVDAAHVIPWSINNDLTTDFTDTTRIFLIFFREIRVWKKQSLPLPYHPDSPQI
jgi:hypothetical protein